MGREYAQPDRAGSGEESERIKQMKCWGKPLVCDLREEDVVSGGVLEVGLSDAAMFLVKGGQVSPTNIEYKEIGVGSEDELRDIFRIDDSLGRFAEKIGVKADEVDLTGIISRKISPPEERRLLIEIRRLYELLNQPPPERLTLASLEALLAYNSELVIAVRRSPEEVERYLHDHRIIAVRDGIRRFFRKENLITGCGGFFETIEVKWPLQFNVRKAEITADYVGGRISYGRFQERLEKFFANPAFDFLNNPERSLAPHQIGMESYKWSLSNMVRTCGLDGYLTPFPEVTIQGGYYR